MKLNLILQRWDGKKDEVLCPANTIHYFLNGDLDIICEGGKIFKIKNVPQKMYKLIKSAYLKEIAIEQEALVHIIASPSFRKLNFMSGSIPTEPREDTVFAEVMN